MIEAVVKFGAGLVVLSAPFSRRDFWRSWVAFDLFCCSTDGAVGKKSAKPAEERDMVRSRYNHPSTSLNILVRT